MGQIFTLFKFDLEGQGHPWDNMDLNQGVLHQVWLFYLGIAEQNTVHKGLLI